MCVCGVSVSLTQVVADAYFVLSDPERRREYDSLYKTNKERTADPSASTNFFANFANMFSGKGPEHTPENAERPDPDGVFADVFDEVSGVPLQSSSSLASRLTITFFPFPCGLAPTARDPGSGTVVGVRGSCLWCRFRFHRREHSWPYGWSVRWEPPGCD